MKTLNKYSFLLAISILSIWSSCKVEKVKTVTETVKSIAGSWGVIKIMRNGQDITNFQGIDLSKFRVVFTDNKTYTIVNQIPFIVNQPGSYSLNDPQVPTEITFTANGGQPLTTLFKYPIANGVRNITIQFTANPGCNDNSYVYTLQKIN